MEDADIPSPGNEIVKRSYSDDEIAHLYEFGRIYLENGMINRAEVVFQGLVHVAPDYAPAWLGLSYIYIMQKNYDEAVFASRQALRIDMNFTEAMLFLAACLLSTGDFHTAGTQLGEIGERIDAGFVDNPDVVRFFRIQIARFQNR